MKDINLKILQVLFLKLLLIFCVRVEAAQIYHMPIHDVLIEPGDFIEVIYNIVENKEIMCDSNISSGNVNEKQLILTYYNQTGMHDAKLPVHLTLGAGQSLDTSGILWISNYQNDVEGNVSCDYAHHNMEIGRLSVEGHA